ncbi:MAG TPA: NAD(P)-binding domain-containing protein [Candidatus Limnocylindrales bacterium]|nr:NAD(P)-binding domain-containing protein [Candidatus Limnocylindrales bacterium]
MRIAILGAGNVGGALGTAFRAVGHDVVFGVRDPASSKTRAALDAAPGSTATDPTAAVDGTDAIVFSLRWDAAEAMIADLRSLDGRVVIDAMNRFSDPLRSTTQDLADRLPAARVVKAFNTTGFENMSTARSRSQKAAMFVAGDDPEAKRVAMDLARQIGFEPEDAGPLANAKILEDMVKVWLVLSQVHGRRIAFAISRR